MAKKTFIRSQCLEMHCEAVPKSNLPALHYLLDEQTKQAYDHDGKPLGPDKIRICLQCNTKVGQMPFTARTELDFAKHMATVHKDSPKPPIAKKKTKKG